MIRYPGRYINDKFKVKMREINERWKGISFGVNKRKWNI